MNHNQQSTGKSIPSTGTADIELDGARILVTGGTGFLGTHVLSSLRRKAEHAQIFSVGSADCNLTNAQETAQLFDRIRPHIVIHLAATVGGIGANLQKPGDFFRSNVLMGIHVLHEASVHNVRNMILVGTVCSYPAHTPVPFREDSFWDGYPDPTNAPYGLAKKMLLVQAEAYHTQFGQDFIYLIPSNLYGPGDHWEKETSHVIPAIIRKCLEAVERGDRVIQMWGDGSPTRDFLYVQDAADAITGCLAFSDIPEPLNIGSGTEISIRDITQIICDMTGFQGSVQWDIQKPNGQMRRCLDISRARDRISFEPRTTLQEGLRQTIAWYRDRLKQENPHELKRGSM